MTRRPRFLHSSVAGFIMDKGRHEELPSATNARPFGVVAIVALWSVLAACSVVYAALISAERIPLSSGAWLLGGGLEQLGRLAFVLYAALALLIAVGLAKRWRWGRRATILVAAAGVALFVPAISSAVGDSRPFAVARESLQIVVRVLIIFYLSQEPVKEWFAGPR